MSETLPRGIRNNNPGNIRRDDTEWLGLAYVQTDPEFFQFQEAKYGLRAMFKILHSYQLRGLTTVREWIYAWAPPSDHNDTGAYLAAVCKHAMISADRSISMADAQDAEAIVAGMVFVENGQVPYGNDLIWEAYQLAFRGEVA